MAGEVQVGLTGFVQKDPELRFTTNGDAVAALTVKVTPRKRVGDKWTNGEPSWFRVSVWGKAGEAVAEKVREDDRVTVTGTLEMRSYEKDGEKRTVPEIRAESIGIVPSVKESAKAAGTTSEGSPW